MLEQLSAKDSRIRIITQPNSGVTRARFNGIEHANGSWLGFMDGDDYIEPDMYEMLLGNAKKYNADISHCGYRMIVGERTDYYYNTGRIIEQNNHEGLRDLLSGEFVEPGLWNKLFKKDLFKKLLTENLMDFSLKNNEDLLMNFFLFQESEKSVFEDKCPYHYIVRSGSATSGKLKINQLTDPLKVMDFIYNSVSDNAELANIAERRILGNLIGLASRPLMPDRELIFPIRKAARKRLKKMLLPVLIGRFSIKQKLQTLITALFPWLYGFIHHIYGAATGINNKYRVK